MHAYDYAPGDLVMVTCWQGDRRTEFRAVVIGIDRANRVRVRCDDLQLSVAAEDVRLVEPEAVARRVA